MCTRSRENVPSAVPEFYFLPEIQRKWIWVTEVKDTDSDEWTRVSVTITIASQTEVNLPRFS